jgi:hypothetical protein
VEGRAAWWGRTGTDGGTPPVFETMYDDSWDDDKRQHDKA